MNTAPLPSVPLLAAALLGALFALVFTPGCSVLPSAEVTPRFGPLDIQGDLALSDAGLSTSSSIQALGAKEDSSVFSPRADIAVGPLSLTLSSFKSHFSGDGIAEAQIDLGGTTIPVNEPVHTELDFGMTTASATWDFIPGSNFEAGLGLALGILDLDADLQSLTTPALAIASGESALFPLLCARTSVSFGPFEASALLQALSVATDGVNAHIRDLDLLARWQIGNLGAARGHIALGWRDISCDIEYSDGASTVLADLEFSGPYFGLTLSL